MPVVIKTHAKVEEINPVFSFCEPVQVFIGREEQIHVHPPFSRTMPDF